MISVGLGMPWEIWRGFTGSILYLHKYKLKCAFIDYPLQSTRTSLFSPTAMPLSLLIVSAMSVFIAAVEYEYLAVYLSVLSFVLRVLQKYINTNFQAKSLNICLYWRCLATDVESSFGSSPIDVKAFLSCGFSMNSSEEKMYTFIYFKTWNLTGSSLRSTCTIFL